MKIFPLLTVGIFALFPALLHAEEVKIIKFNELPATVQQSVLLYTKRDDIKKIELIHDENVIKYEVETSDKGVGFDISLAQDGKILELEKVIALTSLPAVALVEIKKDYPKIKIQNIEAVQEFYYNVEGIVDGKNIEFKVLATGDIEDETNGNDQKD